MIQAATLDAAEREKEAAATNGGDGGDTSEDGVPSRYDYADDYSDGSVPPDVAAEHRLIMAGLMEAGPPSGWLEDRRPLLRWRTTQCRSGPRRLRTRRRQGAAWVCGRVRGRERRRRRVRRAPTRRAPPKGPCSDPEPRSTPSWRARARGAVKPCPGTLPPRRFGGQS
jgi:hypothetical protein